MLHSVPNTEPREMAVIHSIAHDLICRLPECQARRNEWCANHPGQGHHLERYYRAHESALISRDELRAVMELSRPRGNSYAFIPVAT
jgi:hypothetical protein